MVYMSKKTSIGYIEIRDSGVTGWYALYINGSLSKQSASYDAIVSEYNKY